MQARSTIHYPIKMTILTIFCFLVIHWVADFIFQTDKDAKGKSSNMGHLLSHTTSYTLTWFVCGFVYAVLTASSAVYLLYFCIITFISHTITDYYTSRLNSYLWKKGDTHNFFVSIGFDQILHYMQLFLTYKLLVK